MGERATKSGLAPLRVTCTSSDCDSDLHCFKATRKLVKESRAGACRSCGIELIDWQRVHHRSIEDVTFTFDALRRELIRHYFWHLEFDEKAMNHARRKGRRKLYEAALRRIESSVLRAGMPFDGRQTPRAGNTIYYAQHATASCCRRCIEYWHAIPRDRDLTPEEVQYLTALVVCYLDERLTELSEEPMRVSPKRRMTNA